MPTPENPIPTPVRGGRGGEITQAENGPRRGFPGSGQRRNAPEQPGELRPVVIQCKVPLLFP